jgi:hypothetical protein
MSFARRSLAVAVMAAAFGPAFGCGSAAPPARADEPEESIAVVHVSRCGGCHRLPDPKTRTREHLEDALSRHRKRVHLTSEEWAQMIDYLAMPEGKTARQP